MKLLSRRGILALGRLRAWHRLRGRVPQLGRLEGLLSALGGLDGLGLVEGRVHRYSGRTQEGFGKRLLSRRKKKDGDDD